jgi:hypothetical protein
MEAKLSTQDDLDQRLQRIERALRTQRRITTALTTFAFVGCLAAAQSAEPDVVRARRFEIVDAQGNKVGAYGIGALGPAGVGDGERLGWVLRDPSGNASACAWVDDVRKATRKDLVPTASIELQGGRGVLHASATDRDAVIHANHDGVRAARLETDSERTSLELEGPDADAPDESRPVLRLSHSTGKPTIQGWDEHGNVAIDIK